MKYSTFNIQYSKKSFQNGFTFPEIVIVMGIIAILLGFATINLVQAQKSTALNSATDVLVADVRSQQLKAMVGDTEGRGSPDSYGIHFNTSSYTLFHGTTYNANDPSNFTITLDTSLSFTLDNFPSGNIIFQRITGEISGFSQTNSSITLQTTSGQNKIITINQYGVVTNAQ